MNGLLTCCFHYIAQTKKLYVFNIFEILKRCILLVSRSVYVHLPDQHVVAQPGWRTRWEQRVTRGTPGLLEVYSNWRYNIMDFKTRY